MKRWPMVKIKSVTTKVGSGATPRGGEAIYKRSGVPLIRSMNVHFDGFRSLGLVYIDDKEASLLNHVEVQRRDVLFNITGASIGRVTTAPAEMEGARVNQHVCIIRPTTDLLPGFLSYYLRSPEQQALIGSNQVGGTRQAVTKEMLLNWEVPLPPLAEQERIVKLLDEAAELRKLRDQADRRAAALIPALFYEMFGDPEANPHGWPLRSLEEVTTSTKLGLVRGAKEMDESLPFAYIRMDAIRGDGRLALEPVRRVKATAAEVREFSLIRGDFLFNTRNSRELVGKTALFDSDGTFLFNNNIMRIRFANAVEPRYAIALFQTDFLRRQLEARKSGTTSVVAIYYKNLRDLRVLVPPIALQQEFAQRVTAIRDLEAAQAACRARLDALFQSTLHRAFAGEL